MRGYQFPFQKILEVKEKNREQEEVNYAKILKQLDQESLRLTQLVDSKENLLSEIVDLQRNKVAIMAINQSQDYINYLNKQIASQKNNIARIKNSLSHKQQQLIELKVDEKKWVKLSEKKFREYQYAVDLEEQKETDEIALNSFK